MNNPFKEGDIGKIIRLELDPSTDTIAKALGASQVFIRGKLLKLHDEYLTLEARISVGGFRPRVKRTKKEIKYDDILNYEISKYKL